MRPAGPCARVVPVSATSPTGPNTFSIRVGSTLSLTMSEAGATNRKGHTSGELTRSTAGQLNRGQCQFGALNGSVGVAVIVGGQTWVEDTTYECTARSAMSWL